MIMIGTVMLCINIYSSSCDYVPCPTCNDTPLLPPPFPRTTYQNLTYYYYKSSFTRFLKWEQILLCIICECIINVINNHACVYNIYINKENLAVINSRLVLISKPCHNKKKKIHLSFNDSLYNRTGIIRYHHLFKFILFIYMNILKSMYLSMQYILVHVLEYKSMCSSLLSSDSRQPCRCHG